MADINRVTLTGRIGNDLELRSTASGISVCAFRLAVERPKAKGADTAETDWLDLVAWRGQAEFVTKYLSKGRKICVDCSVRTRKWEDKDGNARKSVEFLVNQIVPADSRPQQSQNQNQNGQQAYYQPQGDDFTELADDDTLPF
ncbi:MAG: single-stranded DNA-binding protein [Clostridia bacterium]|nr:single-stranded DNA-binding protein [Clostridia bacterium]